MLTLPPAPPPTSLNKLSVGSEGPDPSALTGSVREEEPVSFLFRNIYSLFAALKMEISQHVSQYFYLGPTHSHPEMAPGWLAPEHGAAALPGGSTLSCPLGLLVRQSPPWESDAC